jgi:hypothetical protein
MGGRESEGENRGRQTEREREREREREGQRMRYKNCEEKEGKTCHIETAHVLHTHGQYVARTYLQCPQLAPRVVPDFLPPGEAV